MVALVVSLSAALVLGLTSWVPRYITGNIGMEDVGPGMLTVAKGAQGVVTLGSGYVVSLYPSGFRLEHDDDRMLDTVTRGAPVSAVLGTVGEPDQTEQAKEPQEADEADGEEQVPQEQVTGVLSTVHIRRLEFLPGLATYRGTVSGTVDGIERTLPLLIRVSLHRGVIEFRADIAGADAVVFHLDYQHRPKGLLPGLPDRSLRRRAWWVEPTAPAGPVFTWELGTRIGIFPVRRPRGVDLRGDGRIDLHAWDDRAALTIGWHSPPVPDSQP